MSNNTDMVKKNSAGALSPVSLRSDAGKGTEELKSSDKSTVILKILHQLSPECNTRNAKYVEGAKPGMIYSGSMGTLIDGDKGLEVVVVILTLDIQNGKREETVQQHQSVLISIHLQMQ